MGLFLGPQFHVVLKMKYVPIPKVPRVHLPFCISVGTTDPRMGLVHPSRSVVSDSLQPRGLQHARLPCPSLSPRVCSNSGPSNHLTSVALFSSCLQYFPASGSFPVSGLIASGGQSIGASALGFPLGWTGWISLQSKGLLRGFSNTTVQKHQFFDTQLSL